MSVNKAIIKGRIGNDLVKNGTMVKFSVAPYSKYSFSWYFW